MGKLGSFLCGALTGAVALGVVSYFVATADEKQRYALDDDDDDDALETSAAAGE